MIEVDTERCSAVAGVLGQNSIPRDDEEMSTVHLRSDAVDNFYLLAVGICHQTQELSGSVGGVPARGWDYLVRRLEQCVEADHSIVSPKAMAATTAAKLAAYLGGGELLSPRLGLERRASLIRDIGRRMQRNGWETLADLYELAEGRCVTGEPNLQQLLSSFEAYQDPVHKKACFLLGLLANTLGWTYGDQDHLGPPVDYHEVRGHLRLGTVRVTSPSLNRRLLARVPVSESEDIHIRTAVRDAILRIAAPLTPATPMQLHYLFWNLFRNICGREQALCRGCPPITPLPHRYHYLIDTNPDSRSCPFSEVCLSAGSPKYVEHMFDTDWY